MSYPFDIDGVVVEFHKRQGLLGGIFTCVNPKVKFFTIASFSPLPPRSLILTKDTFSNKM